jgi:hypothetical protein
MILTNKVKGQLKASGYTCYFAYEVYDALRGVWRESGCPVRDEEIDEVRATMANRLKHNEIRNTEFHVL